MEIAKFNPGDEESLKAGISRDLAPGLSTHIFPGEKSMVSLVRIEAGKIGTVHSHDEEQWSVVLEGSGTRYLGEDSFRVVKGDVFQTPPNIPHTIKADGETLLVLDFFSPMREAYLKPGSGFASKE